MNVEELLEMMEETLEAGTIVPFSASKRMVDVDRMRDIIDEVRNNLPDEIRESKKIVNDREQIMQNARIESESIIQQAEERARVLTSEQEIVKRSAGILDVAIEPDGAMEIAKRSRGTPRIANRMLRRVRDFAQVVADGVITKDVADKALLALEVDALGLDNVDRRMLRAIIENYGGGPVGLDTLAATIGEESVTLEDVYEPYLMQLGFLTRMPRGRCVTRKAYEHLHMAMPRRFDEDDGQQSMY